MKYANINTNPVLPLRYLGVINSLQQGTKICELWLGPTGDPIYHFHDPYPEELDVPPMVGVPTYAKRNEIDNGFAFLFVRSNNPIWHPTIVFSFVEQFKKSTLYLGNGPRPNGNAFSDIPSELVKLQEKLIVATRQSNEVTFAFGPNCGDRFLAKIALGIGSLILNQNFVLSHSANLLRRFMWEKSVEKRSEIGISGSGFFTEKIDSLKRILDWPGGHLLNIIQVKDRLLLYTSFFGAQEAVITISSEPEHWQGKVDEGLVYVVAPGIQKYVGPKGMGEFIAHKAGNYLDQELSALEDEMQQYSELPPFDI